MELSICIPTYNRAKLLDDCLQSIYEQDVDFKKVEICISQNGSTDDSRDVIQKWAKRMSLVVNHNETNLGIPRNFLKVVSLAKGKFVWLLGDDDIVVPGAIEHVVGMIESHDDVDFFLFNSWNLADREGFLSDIKTPADHDGSRFWLSGDVGKMAFAQVIARNITFDHLGGMYLSVFRKDVWEGAEDALDKVAIESDRLFDSHHNTFPHVQIFAKGFMDKTAYVDDTCISYAFSDARDWSPYYPLVRSIRLVESLDAYKFRGLEKRVYRKLKSKTLIHFAEDILKMTMLKNKFYGVEYIRVWKVISQNIFYAGFWQSCIGLIGKTARKLAMVMIGPR